MGVQVPLSAPNISPRINDLRGLFPSVPKRASLHGLHQALNALLTLRIPLCIVLADIAGLLQGHPQHPGPTPRRKELRCECMAEAVRVSVAGLPDFGFSQQGAMRTAKHQKLAAGCILPQNWDPKWNSG